MTRQLSLDLPARTARGRDSFFVAPSNAMALAMIDAWADWPQGKLLLEGPKGAGKSHLAQVWATMSGARVVAAREVTEAAVPELASGPLVVEDLPEIAGQTDTEAALFHLHNLILAEQHPLLMTGIGPVAGWPVVLPDLKSRLQGTAAVALDPPDDSLLQALLVKLLADRQLTPKPNLVPYLLGRIDRSFAAAIEVVARLDAASLARKRPLTRALAAEVLGEEQKPQGGEGPSEAS